MNLLLTLALSAALVTPVRPIIVEPDSGSVAFTIASTWLRVSPAFDTTGIALLPRGAEVRIIDCRKQTCQVEFRRLQGFVLRELLRTTPVTDPVDLGPETALALLMGEHRLSLSLYIGEASDPSTTQVLHLP